jgi:hypothetical protein
MGGSKRKGDRLLFGVNHRGGGKGSVLDTGQRTKEYTKE